MSLKPVLEDPTVSVKPVALSTFPRCAHIGMPDYGARGALHSLFLTQLKPSSADY